MDLKLLKLKQYYQKLSKSKPASTLLEEFKDVYSYKGDIASCLHCKSLGSVNSSSESFYKCQYCSYVIPMRRPIPGCCYVRCQCRALMIVRQRAKSVRCSACGHTYSWRHCLIKKDLILPLMCHCGQEYITRYKHRNKRKCPKCYTHNIDLTGSSHYYKISIPRSDVNCIFPKWIALISAGIICVVAGPLYFIMRLILQKQCTALLTPFPLILLMCGVWLIQLGRLKYRRAVSFFHDQYELIELRKAAYKRNNTAGLQSTIINGPSARKTTISDFDNFGDAGFNEEFQYNLPV